MNHVLYDITDRNQLQQVELAFADVVQLHSHPVKVIRDALSATCDRLGFLPDTIHRKAVIDAGLDKFAEPNVSPAAAVEHGFRVAQSIRAKLDAVAKRFSRNPDGPRAA